MNLHKSNRAGNWRDLLTKIGVIALSVSIASVLDIGVQAQPRYADLVLQHGVVLTMDTQDHVMQAVAVRGGKLLAVGSDKGIAALIGPHTQVVDLAGHAVTPGLIDTHAHILLGGLQELFQINLKDTASLGELLAKVKARAKVTPAGQWINGGSWNESIIAEHRPPTLAELDAVSDGRPVLLEHFSQHSVMVNSAAMKVARISKDTRDPPGGAIVRDPSGRPTGILKESAAMNLVRVVDPPPSLAQRKAAIKAHNRPNARRRHDGSEGPLAPARLVGGISRSCRP